MSGKMFCARFRALTGNEPYHWQQRLYGRMVAGEMHDGLDLPTGLGKTSVMAIWLCARIDASDEIAALILRRLLYGVDRRAVVDQATREAEKLAARLEAYLRDESIAASEREHIVRRLGLDHTYRIPISTLRGQYVDNRRWLDDPAVSAIVVGTIDMIGSRLLFSGYGVSRGMRPLHAAFIAQDTLIVLDEAHLVPAFEALLGEARRAATEDSERAWQDKCVGPRPFRLMTLSATGQERENARVFRLDGEDKADPPVAARLAASKKLRLLAPTGLKGAPTVFAEEARRLAGDGRRVIVFTNSRDLASRIAAALEGKADRKVAELPSPVELLVGERRILERMRLTGDAGLGLVPSAVFARFLPDASAEGEGPCFLVATSAGEVGIDIDADDLVCDLVSWERMVQRFGRVNRRAAPGVARISVIPVPFNDRDGEDMVLEGDLRRYSSVFDDDLWPLEDGGVRDVSPGRLVELKSHPELRARFDAATTPPGLRPPLTRAELQAWSLTSLARHTGRPLVAPWLRGWEKQEAQTAIVWRRWLPVRAGAEGEPTPELKAFLQEHAPPHASEILEASSWRVAKELCDGARRYLKSAAKSTREATEESDDAPSSRRPPRHAPLVVVLAADRTVSEVLTAERLGGMAPDRFERLISYGTLVVDARLGCLQYGLLNAKSADPPPTIDDDSWPAELGQVWDRRVRFGPEALRADGCWKAAPFRWFESDEENARVLLVDLRRGAGDLGGDPAIAARAQALEDHLGAVARHAARLADDLGLDAPLRSVLLAAAEAHDLGKARDLWQDAMNAPRDGGRPYAKTDGGGDGRALDGYRHEFGSLRDVLSDPERFLHRKGVTAPALQDLALHLILAHHGRGRPNVEPYDPDQLPSASDALARDAALRFVRLQAAWGVWGLAWWEAMLRAADRIASRELNDPAAPGEAPHV